jgi:HSP20 family protein
LWWARLILVNGAATAAVLSTSTGKASGALALEVHKKEWKMAVMRWDPFRDLMERERELERVFGSPFERLFPWLRGADGAAGELDLYETDDAVVAKAFLPGVKPEDIKITVTAATLRIEAESKNDQEVKDEQYLRKEHRYGKYVLSAALPSYAQAEKAEATYDHGTLTIRMPKAEPSKTKTITVNVAQK